MRSATAGLIATLAVGLLAAPLLAHAQPPGKVPRIGILSCRPEGGLGWRPRAPGPA